MIDITKLKFIEKKDNNGVRQLKCMSDKELVFKTTRTSFQKEMNDLFVNVLKQHENELKAFGSKLKALQDELAHSERALEPLDE